MASIAIISASALIALQIVDLSPNTPPPDTRAGAESETTAPQVTSNLADAACEGLCPSSDRELESTAKGSARSRPKGGPRPTPVFVKKPTTATPADIPSHDDTPQPETSALQTPPPETTTPERPLSRIDIALASDIDDQSPVDEEGDRLEVPTETDVDTTTPGTSDLLDDDEKNKVIGIVDTRVTGEPSDADEVDPTDDISSTPDASDEIDTYIPDKAAPASEAFPLFAVNSIRSSNHNAPAEPSLQPLVTELTALKTIRPSVPLPRADSTGNYYVQVLATPHEDSLCAIWDALRAELPHLFAFANRSITRVETGDDQILFRLRVGAFQSRKEASVFCESLQDAGHGCFVPEQDV